MTQEEFKKLPGLLLRKQFQDITGLSDRDLDSMTITCNQLTPAEMERLRACGLLPVFRPQLRAAIGGKHCGGKYYKQDAARMGGFQL